MYSTTPAGWNSDEIEMLQDALKDDGPEVPAGPSEFWRVSVVIAGALDQTEEFVHKSDVENFLQGLEHEAEVENFTAEVYVLYHPHAPGQDCECVQYETDLRPDYIFNPQDGGDQ